jgi:hypothetical protein
MTATKLMYDKATNVKVDRAFLEQVYTPPATDTHQPVAHSRLVDVIEEALAFRHIRIENSEFALSKDGMKMFGLLTVNQVYEGVEFAIGLRNSNDKSMRLGMVAGYKVTVCSNMMLAGDFSPLLAKHSKNFDVIEGVAMGIDRIQRGWKPLREQIDFKRETQLHHDGARLLVYKAFAQHGLPVSLFNKVSKTLENGETPTLWELENVFTDSFKSLKPVAQFQAATKLNRALMEPVVPWAPPTPFEVIEVRPSEPSPDMLN